MAKLKLDELGAESFDTTETGAGFAGTVRTHDSVASGGGRGGHPHPRPPVPRLSG